MNSRTNRRRLAVALSGSFVVYLLPLVGPHAAWLVGEVLLRETSTEPARTAAWIAADVGFAFLLQALTFVILVWALRQPLRLTIFIVVLPALWLAAQTMYLFVIPARFLIEADTAPALNSATERCLIEKASLLPVRTPVDLPTLPVGEWWLQYPDGSYGLLHAADCSVTKATLPQPKVENGRADFTLGFAQGGGCGEGLRHCFAVHLAGEPIKRAVTGIVLLVAVTVRVTAAAAGSGDRA